MPSTFVRVPHPGGNVSLAMQHAPEVDVAALLDVEEQIGVGGQRPASQTGQIEFMRMAWRTAGRVTADVAESLFQGIDETKRGLHGALANVILDGVVDIPLRLQTRDDRLHA